MATGGPSGEALQPIKDEISSQESLGQSVLAPAAVQEAAERQAAASAAPGQDCVSARDTSRPPIAASQEAAFHEPVGAAAEVQPQEVTRGHQLGERLTPAKSARRPIILAGAVVLALVVAVCLRSGLFAPGTPAPGPAPKISAAEALGKGDEAWRRKDYAAAAHWYRRAADQGNSEAQNNVGWLYENGRGVAQDYGEAMRWFRLAAEQANAPAQANIGRLYENGRGVAQDYGEAMRWYRTAADNGGAIGQVNVGRLYANGRGVPQDYSEAMHWYRKAADRGDAAAQYDIGWLYENGWGVAQDYERRRAGTARPWTRAALLRGPMLGSCICVGTARPPTREMPRRRPSSGSYSRMVGAWRGTGARRCAGIVRPPSKDTP
jgi:TPR repeat protein